MFNRKNIFPKNGPWIFLPVEYEGCVYFDILQSPPSTEFFMGIQILLAGYTSKIKFNVHFHASIIYNKIWIMKLNIKSKAQNTHYRNKHN